MNIISYFNQILEENFNKYLKNYFNKLNYCNKTSSFCNYFSFINDLDDFSDSFIKNIIKGYFEYIDDCFFDSSYRRKNCKSNGFYVRKNYVTLFGKITLKRRYYYDNKTNEWFFFTDLFLGLPKRKHFDPFVCADICEYSTSNSYSKTGKLVAEKIAKRTSNNINISRATARNIVISFNPNIDPEKEQRRIERLFVMLDEKFVGSQFNNGEDHMIKAAVVFENTELVYKSKKKESFMDRYRLVNSHVCASIDDNLLNDTVNYILNNWKERQLYQNNPYMKCSMESHISHIFADLFTSRPKAYSKKGLRKLLELRVLKTNGTDIKQLYLQQLINSNITPMSQTNKINKFKKLNAKENKYNITHKILFPYKTNLYN